MGGEDGYGLTLEGLAQRLEALERENSDLRDEVATLRGSGTGEAVEFAPALEEGRGVSRRALLRNAGAAALGAVAAGTLLARDASVAKANHYKSGISVDFVRTHNESDRGAGVKGTAPAGTGVWGQSAKTGYSGVYGQHTQEIVQSTDGGYGVVGDGSGSFAGVLGRSTLGTGVQGIGGFLAGVQGKTTSEGNLNGYGVYGEAPRNNTLGAGVYGQGGKTGVQGFSNNPDVEGVGVSGEGKYGVVGKGNGFSYAGVLGRNPSGTGVRGEGSTEAELNAGVRGIGKTGVWGTSSADGRQGVYGEHTGSGYGVVGDGGGTEYAGVLGRSSTSYGGRFEGGKAQLMLKPGSSAGKPSGSHSQGELYLDSAGTLFVCTASGNPATWRQVTTTAV